MCSPTWTTRSLLLLTMKVIGEATEKKTYEEDGETEKDTSEKENKDSSEDEEVEDISKIA